MCRGPTRARIRWGREVQLGELVAEFLRYEAVRGSAVLTVKNRQSHLAQFLGYLETCRITEAAELAAEHIEKFAEVLTFSAGRGGKPRVEKTRNGILISVKLFCRWLLQHDYVAVDAAVSVPYAKEPENLPRGVPSEEAVLRLLAAPNSQTTKGFRDRTILELLYVTGVRVRELNRLDLGDIDLTHGFALVHGKGSRDRLVPLGRRLSGTLTSYLAAIRPTWAKPDEQALIVNYLGHRLSTEGAERLVLRYAAQAELGRITPHLLRHACATHMMQHGANLRHVQELLGHKDITTTEIYTKLTQKELLQAHATYHPRSREPLESNE